MKQGVGEMFHIVTASSYCCDENGAGVKLGNAFTADHGSQIYILARIVVNHYSDL